MATRRLAKSASSLQLNIGAVREELQKGMLSDHPLYKSERGRSARGEDLFVIGRTNVEVESCSIASVANRSTSC